MTPREIAEVAEVLEMLRQLPAEARKEICFMIKGAAMVADMKG